MARDYMTTPIPVLPETMRNSLGIHQSDIVIRTAVMAGLADLRANPDLLDYVFSSLPRDPVTYKDYGEEQVQIAKEWFLAQDIPVFMNTRLDADKVPCITIAINASNEDASTLGDVNYTTSEPTKNTKEIVYGGPYTPLAYDPSTGYLLFPTTFDLEVFPGMYLRLASGKRVEIIDVIDNFNIAVAENLNEDFRKCYVVSIQQNSVSLEGIEFRETYEIGAHALGEPVYLTYLHSILVFILLRYKEELLEARGLERTTISSGPVILNTSFNISQPVFSRMVQMTGYVRQMWPKFVRGPIEGVTGSLTLTAGPSYAKRGVIPAAYPKIEVEE